MRYAGIFPESINTDISETRPYLQSQNTEEKSEKQKSICNNHGEFVHTTNERR